MISRFFIDRPIFAAVLSIVITLAGGIALTTLPIAMYPPISPPVVQVDCSYPGASAQVVAQTVATPIEQQVNGVENMLYMSSQCTNDGAYNLTVTFKHGVDLNMAQVLVQNRVSLAVPLLPDVIKQTGVTTRKKAPDILLALALTSPDKTRDQLFLSNYALMSDEGRDRPAAGRQRHRRPRPARLQHPDLGRSGKARLPRHDRLRRGKCHPQAKYAGRLRPDRPASVAKGQGIQIPLSTHGRLVEPEEFEQMIIKMSADGRIVRLKDVAKIELGAKNEDITGSNNYRMSRINGTYQPLLQLIGFTGRIIILCYGSYLIITGKLTHAGHHGRTTCRWARSWRRISIGFFHEPDSELRRLLQHSHAGDGRGGANLFAAGSQAGRARRGRGHAPAQDQRAGDIENVTFGYNPDRPVLHDVSFETESGRRSRWWVTPAAARAASFR